MGMTLGVISFGSGFVRYGHGGASLNPARCLGVFVGGRWEGWHWIHWYVFHIFVVRPLGDEGWKVKKLIDTFRVADIAACIVHGLFYFLIPPWEELEEMVQKHPSSMKGNSRS